MWEILDRDKGYLRRTPLVDILVEIVFYARHTSAAIFGSDKSKFPTEWYYLLLYSKLY